LELVCDIDAEVPDVLVADAMRIRQVLVNLLGNAVKFTERGEAVVSVRLEREGAGTAQSGMVLLFAVRDTGIGVPVFEATADIPTILSSRWIHHAQVRRNGFRAYDFEAPGGDDGRANLD